MLALQGVGLLVSQTAHWVSGSRLDAVAFKV